MCSGGGESIVMRSLAVLPLRSFFHLPPPINLNAKSGSKTRSKNPFRSAGKSDHQTGYENTM